MFHMKAHRRDAGRITGRRGAALPAGRLARLSLGAAVFSGAAAGAALAGARLAARRFGTPEEKETRFLTPWELGLPYEDVAFWTEDGLRLGAWWLPNPEARRTVVILSGHNGARQDTLGIGGALYRAGSNVLLLDNRGRGSSEGDRVSLGGHERLDARAAVGYALGRAPEVPLALLGYSMGGAVALMTAADDRRVGAVVADSPFASQRELLLRHLRERIGPLAGPTLALASTFLDYRMSEVEPVRYVARISPRPLLLIHGEQDDVTDPNDSRRMFAAAGEPKELWTVPEAAHVESYYADREVYCRRVIGFLDRSL